MCGEIQMHESTSANIKIVDSCRRAVRWDTTQECVVTCRLSSRQVGRLSSLPSVEL